jgi:hypothetical protein
MERRRCAQQASDHVTGVQLGTRGAAANKSSSNGYPSVQTIKAFREKIGNVVTEALAFQVGLRGRAGRPRVALGALTL